MRKGIYVAVALLLCVAAKTYFGSRSSGSKGSQSILVTTASASPAGADDPCKLPTRAPDPNDAKAVAETAWRIFVAINCPANKTQLVWETWSEQYTIYTQPGQPVGNPSRLHGSALGAILSADSPGAKAGELNPVTGCQKLFRPPSNMPNPQTKSPVGYFCEEVHLDPTARAYILQHGYQFRIGQQQAVVSSTAIQFPTTAVEVKADWFPAKDFDPAQFTCTSPSGLHTEMIAGECYALVGMHINSKLLPNWLWATFEPQNAVTNPQRCSTSLFGPCYDPFGSNPATSSGGTIETQQTPALAALMKQAHLAPEFSNYRMDGAQVDFGTTQNPTLLGNSIIEGETVPGIFKGQASCISCHSASVINNAGIEIPTKPVGPEPPPSNWPPSGYMRRDFVWSLGEACTGSVFNSNPNCLNTKAPPIPTASTK